MISHTRIEQCSRSGSVQKGGSNLNRALLTWVGDVTHSPGPCPFLRLGREYGCPAKQTLWTVVGQDAAPGSGPSSGRCRAIGATPGLASRWQRQSKAQPGEEGCLSVARFFEAHPFLDASKKEKRHHVGGSKIPHPMFIAFVRFF